MMIASKRARIIAGITSALLLIPVIGIRYQDVARLQQFHNRVLTPWPDATTFASDPPSYFAKAHAWLADRAYPIAQSSLAYKKFAYHVLRTAPQRRVSLGDNGFIFLNGESDSQVNGLLERICVKAHSPAVADAMTLALANFERYSASKNLSVDVIVVPTSLTIYGDFLPSSVPPNDLKACRDRATGDSPLLNIHATGGVHFVFPFAEMRAARNDEALFPKGNWHPTGLSLKIVRDTYLTAIGRSVVVDERLERGLGMSEIMQTYGIDEELPVYRIFNDHIRPDPVRLQQLRGAVGDLFSTPYFSAHYYSNADSPLSESILIISDSYGDFTSEVFAGAFRSVTQFTINAMPPSRVGTLIDRIRAIQDVDRVVLLGQEGGVEQALGWSRALAD